MKKITHFLFDFDGTLIDSMPTFRNSVLTILNKYGAKYPNDIMKTVTPMGAKDAPKYCISEFDMDIREGEFFDLILEYAVPDYENSIPAKEGVREALSELKKRGYSLNILTGSPHQTLDPCYSRLGFDEYFERSWSVNDFDTNKTDPRIYVETARLLGVDPKNIVFLDDNIDANRAAKAAGLTVIGVYDPSSESFAEQMKRELDGYVYDLRELLDLYP